MFSKRASFTSFLSDDEDSDDEQKNAFDIDWNQTEAIRQKLNDLAAIKAQMQSHNVDGLKLPEICFIGLESSAKSMNMNRLTGLNISESKAGTATLVPIHFHIQPAPTFKLQFRKGKWTDQGNMEQFRQQFSTFMQEIARKDEEERATIVEHVYIEAPGLPHLTFIDLPGSTGKGKAAYNCIARHLEGAGQHDLIILFHSLYKVDGRDDVADLLYEHFGKGFEEHHDKLENIQKMIAENRLLMCATMMDAINGGDTGKKNEKKRLMMKMETTMERIGLLKSDRASVNDMLPNGKWMLTTTLGKTNIGTQMNEAEKTFFDSTIALAEGVLNSQQDNPNKREAEEMSTMCNKWINLVKTSSGIHKFRDTITDIYIKHLCKQKEQCCIRIAEVAKKNAQMLYEKYQWFDLLRANNGNFIMEYDPEKTEHNEQIVSNLLKRCAGPIHNRFRDRLLNDDYFLTFPVCETEAECIKLLETRRTKYVEVMTTVVDECKILAPYLIIKQLIKGHIDRLINEVMSTQKEQLGSILGEQDCLENLFADRSPKSIYKILVHHMLVSNLITIASLTLIDPLSITSTNGGNQFILGKEWATKTNLKTDHEYDEHYKNYILAHNCIEELNKIFARTSGEGGVTNIDKIRDMSLISVPGNEPIEKKYQNRNAVRDYLITKSDIMQGSLKDLPAIVDLHDLKFLKKLRASLKIPEGFFPMLHNESAIISKEKFNAMDRLEKLTGKSIEEIVNGVDYKISVVPSEDAKSWHNFETICRVKLSNTSEGIPEKVFTKIQELHLTGAEKPTQANLRTSTNFDNKKTVYRVAAAKDNVHFDPSSEPVLTVQSAEDFLKTVEQQFGKRPAPTPPIL